MSMGCARCALLGCVIACLSFNLYSPTLQAAEPEADSSWAWTQPSDAMFEDAAVEFGVPADLLKAIAWQESRWNQTGPTIDMGWGVMHLVDNDDAATLKEAAELIGATVEELQTDARANIRGAAALIANYAGEKPDAVEDYYPALKRFTGLNPAVQDTQVREYYRVLSEGVEAENGLGVWVQFDGVAVDMEAIDSQAAKALQKSSDYGPAIWNAAASCNYTSGRGGNSIRYWVNHWVGTGTYAGAISWFKNCNASTSAHFVIRQSDGELTQMVSLGDTAWHAGNWSYNQQSIGIEHEARPDYPWPTSASAPMLVNSANCCRAMCDRYGIPRNRSYIIGHNQIVSTACPGPLPWDTYMSLVEGIPALASAYNNQYYVDTMVAGSTADCWVEYKNTGSETWQQGQVNLGTWNPQDRSSPFFTAGDWLGASRPTNMDAGSCGPGGVARFSFRMTAPSTPGVYSEYWRLVKENVAWFGHDGVWFRITVIIAAPTITAHPANSSVCADATATFNVTASGQQLSYRWQRNNADISDGGNFSGTTTASLRVTGVDGSLTGNYRCKVSNSTGTVYSNNASLSLKAATTVTQQPTAQSACPGAAATFTVAATGDGTLSYQWQRDGSNVSNGGHFSGATSSALTVANVDAGVLGQYRCVVTGGCGNATSSAAALTQRAVTAIQTQPLDIQVCPGAVGTIAVAATGDGTLSYQWQKKGENLANGGHYSGVNSATLTISNVDAADVADYRCVVTGGCTSATSNPAHLSLNAITELTKHPESAARCPGESVSFTAAGVGQGSVSYRWLKDGVELLDGGRIAGAASSTLTLDDLEPADAGDYVCRVSAVCGNQDSTAGHLTIHPATAVQQQPQPLNLCPGETAMFALAAVGHGELSYQWLKDGTDLHDDGRISGAARAALQITDVSAADVGDYTCQVSASCNNVVSSAARLDVKVTTAIVRQPTSVRICLDEAGFVELAAVGTGTSYQWQTADGGEFADVAGASLPRLPLESVSMADDGKQFRCIVAGECGTVISNVVTLTVAASADPSGYSIVDLGTFGGNEAQAFDINEANEIVGFATTAGDAARRAFVYSNGQLTELPNLPGGNNGVAYAINDNGTIVGEADDAAGVPHAVYWQSGQITDLGSIDTLGGAGAIARGINDANQIVGNAQNEQQQWRAFLFSGGNISDRGTFGGSQSGSEAINSLAQIVGWANLAGDTARHAFLYKLGRMTDLGTLGGEESVAYAINTAGQIVGAAQDGAGDWHPFLYDGEVMADLGTFGGSEAEARDINSMGEIVGRAANPEQVPNAFIHRANGLGNLNDMIPACPSWMLNSAEAINDAGHIVGYGTRNNGQTRAFLLVPSQMVIAQQPQDVHVCASYPASFSVTAHGYDLQYQWQVDAGGGFTDIPGANGAVYELTTVGGDDGKQFRCVIGALWGGVTSEVATLQVVGTPARTRYVVIDAGTLGGAESKATGINELGDICGLSLLADDTTFRAFAYRRGQLTELGTLGGTHSGANGINNVGDVVGWSQLAGDAIEHGFVCRDGTMTDLGTLGGPDSSAYALNAGGRIVGQSGVSGSASQAFMYQGDTMTCLGALEGGVESLITAVNTAGQMAGASSTPIGDWHACLYSADIFVDLGTLGGINSQAEAISPTAQIVGWSEIAGSTAVHAFSYRFGTMTDLGTLGGQDSWALGVNRSGQVVGTSDTADGGRHAFLYESGTMIDLNTLIPECPYWELLGAEAINDAGQIAVYGTIRGQVHAAILTPMIAPDFDGDGDVDQSDFGTFQSCVTGAGVRTVSSACQSSDLDGDQDVDLSDFGLFQRCVSGPGAPASPTCRP